LAVVVDKHEGEKRPLRRKEEVSRVLKKATELVAQQSIAEEDQKLKGAEYERESIAEEKKKG